MRFDDEFVSDELQMILEADHLTQLELDLITGLDDWWEVDVGMAMMWGMKKRKALDMRGLAWRG